MCSIDASIPDKSMYCLSAPPLTEVLCYSASNAVVQSKYATKIMSDFYTWLPHIWLVDWLIGWMKVSWLVDWLIGWLIGWLIIDWLSDRLTESSLSTDLSLTIILTCTGAVILLVLTIVAVILLVVICARKRLRKTIVFSDILFQERPYLPHDFLKKESVVDLLPADPMEFPRAKLHLLNRVLGKWLLLPCCFRCYVLLILLLLCLWCSVIM